MREKTLVAVSELIGRGVTVFNAGGALGFDTLAAEIVIGLKKTYPQIKLVLVLPCPEQADKWNAYNREKYHKISACADKLVYVSDEYSVGCMHKRNRFLVDGSAYCICYLKKERGGTAYTVNYAKSRGLIVFNVAE